MYVIGIESEQWVDRRTKDARESLEETKSIRRFKLCASAQICKAPEMKVKGAAKRRRWKCKCTANSKKNVSRKDLVP